VSAVLFGESGAIKAVQSGTIPPELFQSFQQIMDIVRMTMGFSRNQFGEFMGGSEKPSATEAGIVKQASEIRIDERRDIVADGLLDIMQDTNRLIFEHWGTERVERVIGPYGVPIWVKFTGEMLAKGQYDIKVDPDSSLPETKAQREGKALQLFQLLYPMTQQPDAQTGRPLLDSTKLTRLTLHEMQGTKYDDLLYGVPNIYDQEFVSFLTQNDRLMSEPQTPQQLGQAVEAAGAQAGQQQTAALRGAQGDQSGLGAN
ncbi:hypothetical protein LCGC14_1477050, partial [marine sediment metagenome]